MEHEDSVGMQVIAKERRMRPCGDGRIERRQDMSKPAEFQSRDDA